MKNLFKFTLALCAFAVAATMTSCGDDDGGSASGTVVKVSWDYNTTGPDVLEAYASDVVIKRYATLANATKELYTAVVALQTNISGDHSSYLTTACNKWYAARNAWERTEAYLFGPVDVYGIDPGIDSWPLGLSTLASSIRNYGGAFNDESIKSDGGDLKGFHAIEFLLFADGSPKTSINTWSATAAYGTDYGFGSSPTDAELATYLVAITKELYRCTVLLVAEWDNNNASGSADSNIATTYSDVYEAPKEGVYYTTFTTAGHTGNTEFKNIKTALSTILEAATSIADEVGSVKISDPIKSKSILDVESWYSYNSKVDFTNNIIGIKEAYFGEIYAEYTDVNNKSSVYTALTDYEPATKSISAFIAAHDSNLDLDVVNAINNAISKVNNLNEPFKDDLTWSTVNRAAVSACSDLVEALEKAQGAINNGYYTIY